MYIRNIVKINAIRNMRDPDPKDKTSEGGINNTLLGSHKLSKS